MFRTLGGGDSLVFAKWDREFQYLKEEIKSFKKALQRRHHYLKKPLRKITKMYPQIKTEIDRIRYLSEPSNFLNDSEKVFLGWTDKYAEIAHEVLQDLARLTELQLDLKLHSERLHILEEQFNHLWENDKQLAKSKNMSQIESIQSKALMKTLIKKERLVEQYNNLVTEHENTRSVIGSRTSPRAVPGTKTKKGSPTLGRSNGKFIDIDLTDVTHANEKAAKFSKAQDTSPSNPSAKDSGPPVQPRTAETTGLNTQATSPQLSHAEEQVRSANKSAFENSQPPQEYPRISLSD